MSAALMAQPGLHRTATAISTKAKVRGRNKTRKKSTMTGGACATVTVFKVVGEITTETGMYRECFLQLVDLGMTEVGGVWDGGVKGGEDSGSTAVGDGSEGVSGIGSTGRTAKQFEGWGEGIVGAGVE